MVLLIVLMIVLMMCNLWVLFYLTWEHREPQKAARQDCAERTRQKPLPDVMGKSKFRMPERIGTEKDTIRPEAATSVKAEAVDEKDVTFADEMETSAGQIPKARPLRQIPDEELDETFSDRRVSDIAEYGRDEDYDGEPHMAGGFTFEDIDLAVRTAKKPGATVSERRHAGMVFRDMKGNELFSLIEKNSDVSRKRLNELMDFYMDTVAVSARKRPQPTIARKEMPVMPDNFEDFNIRDFV